MMAMAQEKGIRYRKKQAGLLVINSPFAAIEEVSKARLMKQSFKLQLTTIITTKLNVQIGAFRTATLSIG